MYGKRGSENSTSKRVIDLMTGKIYESAMIASEELNLNFSHICATARGTRASTGGRVFRYVLDSVFDLIFMASENNAKIKSNQVRQNVLPEYESLL